jgi:hypothetical protein
VIHPTKLTELLFEMEGLRTRCAELEAERDAARAQVSTAAANYAEHLSRDFRRKGQGLAEPSKGIFLLLADCIAEEAAVLRKAVPHA